MLNVDGIQNNKKIVDKSKDKNLNGSIVLLKDIIGRFFINKDGDIRIESIASIVAVVFFACRAGWYIFMSGFFSAYQLDDVNMEVFGENTIFKTILGMAFIGILIVSNYFCYIIIMGNYKRKLFRIFGLSNIVAIVLVFILYIDRFFSDFSLKVLNFVAIYFALLLISYFINFYGILFGLLDKRELKKNEKNKNKIEDKPKGRNRKKQSYFSYFAALFVLQIIMLFEMGKYEANNKETFETVNNSYVILYENHDNYILAKCDISGDYVEKIYLEEKRIISKLGVDTLTKDVK